MASVYVILIVLTYSFLEIASSAESGNNGGFTTNLIRRDHPEKSNYFEWLSRSVNRSIARADYFRKKGKSSIVSPLTKIGDDGYVMEVSIGTPPVKIVAMADTGSELPWTQCLPCINCFEQNDPLFDPNKTSTYRHLSCDSQACDAVGSNRCDEGSDICTYSYGYEDGDESRGDLAVDTFTFHSSDGKNISFLNTVFGCGHNNRGNFVKNESGVIGLNRGAFSIVNQFSSRIRKKFSYCLSHIDTSPVSEISFGVDAIPPRSKAISTPMLNINNADYYITLEGISVGNNTIDSGISSSLSSQNIIIDSGTTFNYIPNEMYYDLREKLLDTIKARPVKHPHGTFDVCFTDELNLEFPDITFHFADGADVVIPPRNAFFPDEEDLICLLMVPAKEGLGFLGYLSQMNFLIEYDLENEKLSFLPTDCTF